MAVEDVSVPLTFMHSILNEVHVLEIDILHKNSQSTKAISGLRLAAWMSGPMTTGRYWTNCGPMILHILAQALIIYDT